MATRHWPWTSVSLRCHKDSHRAYLKAFIGLDKRLNPLIEYRDFDYWVYDQHRNPVQRVAHLRGAFLQNHDRRTPPNVCSAPGRTGHTK